MKIKLPRSSFEPCPEYTGSAICVDVTPLKKQTSQYGERDVFKLVFETLLEREDGSRFCVWTQNFTPTFHEKANFRKFMRGMLGHDLSMDEMKNFDPETLIGLIVQLVVVHDHKDGETYANIAACTPDKSKKPLQSSGKFVRVKDRPPKDANGYQQAQAPSAPVIDQASVRVHVGRCKGLELRDLAPEQVLALVDNWLPPAKANANPTADDKRLIAALEWWVSSQATETHGDIPY